MASATSHENDPFALSAERRRLYFYLSLVGVAGLPLYRFTLPADAWDPWIFRFILGGLCLGLVILTLLPKLPEKTLIKCVFVVQSFIIGWFEFLIYMNDFRAEYIVTWFIVFFTLATIIYHEGFLRFYILVGLNLPTLLWLLSPSPQFPFWLLFPLSIYGSVTALIGLSFRIAGEKKLEGSGSRYMEIAEAAFEGSKDGILVADLQGHLLKFNTVFERMWDIPGHELRSGKPNAGIDRVYQNLLFPDLWKDTIARIRVNPTLETWDIQRMKDGRIIERFSRPMLKDGKPVGRLWFFRDITIEKNAEEEIRKAITLLRAVFDLSGVGILVLDHNRNVLDYNELYLRIWSMDEKFLKTAQPEEVIAYSQSQLKDANKANRSLRQALRIDDASAPEILEFKDGRLVERTTRRLSEDEEKMGWVFFYRDITALITTSLALHESEAKNRAILTALPDQIFRLDEKGIVLDYKGHGEISGGTTELSGKSVDELFPRDFAGALRESLAKVITSGNTTFFEHPLYRSGARHEYEARLARSGENEVLLILRDITEEKQAEAELDQRNFELDSFIYRASHDLKAPLNSLMGLLDILRGEITDGPAAKYLGLMDMSILKLDTFIRNLALFNKNEKQEITPEDINLHELTHSIIRKLPFLDAGKKNLITLHPAEPMVVRSDLFRLEIILENLLSNAMKYTKPGDPKPMIAVNFSRTENQLTLHLKDNGIGIDPVHQPRIFDLFFRATNQAFGSGMGLYLVKNAVDKLGGNISVFSVPDEGTEFVVTLPLK